MDSPVEMSAQEENQNSKNLRAGEYWRFMPKVKMTETGREHSEVSRV